MWNRGGIREVADAGKNSQGSQKAELRWEKKLCLFYVTGVFFYQISKEGRFWEELSGLGYSQTFTIKRSVYLISSELLCGKLSDGKKTYENKSQHMEVSLAEECITSLAFIRPKAHLMFIQTLILIIIPSQRQRMLRNAQIFILLYVNYLRADVLLVPYSLCKVLF